MVVGIEATHAYKTERTGVEEYCFQIIQELKKVIPATVRVVLYVKEKGTRGKGQGEIELPKNWEMKVLRWPFKKLWSQVRLSLEFLFRPPDIFFAPGQLIPFFCPKNTVVMIHDSAFMAVPRAYRFWGRQYLRWMNKRIVTCARLIITSTEFNKQELHKYYGSAAAAKTVIIPLAYDREQFKTTTEKSPVQSAPVMERYGITKPFILAIGRLEEKKNTARLVQAFNQLKGAVFDLQLVLAGKLGAHYKEIQIAIANSPYRQDIRELGFVPKSDVVQLLGAAQAFVFPSFYEGFGLPLLEAMAVGCPVVAARLPALKEVGGEAALYVNPEDSTDIANALREVLTQEETRVKLIHQGQERAQLFSWRATAEKTWAEIVKIA